MVQFGVTLSLLGIYCNFSDSHAVLVLSFLSAFLEGGGGYKNINYFMNINQPRFFNIYLYLNVYKWKTSKLYSSQSPNTEVYTNKSLSMVNLINYFLDKNQYFLLKLKKIDTIKVKLEFVTLIILKSTEKIDSSIFRQEKCWEKLFAYIYLSWGHWFLCYSLTITGNSPKTN